MEQKNAIRQVAVPWAPSRQLPPGLVVADEPTSALDADRQQAFIALLLEECAAAGAALLFVSHDQRLAAHFDRVLELDHMNRASAACAAEGGA